MKLYCDTCVKRVRKTSNIKCPYCDGYIRQNTKLNEEIVWIKKGLIWVQKK
jgi:hypothetical protein